MTLRNFLILAQNSSSLQLSPMECLPPDGVFRKCSISYDNVNFSKSGSCSPKVFQQMLKRLKIDTFFLYNWKPLSVQRHFLFKYSNGLVIESDRQSASKKDQPAWKTEPSPSRCCLKLKVQLLVINLLLLCGFLAYSRI